MSRSTRIHRWTAAAFLAGAIAIGGTGCIAVPVGGGYGEPVIGFPAPGVVIAPPPIVFGGGYYRGPYYGRGYYGRGYWR